MDAGSIPAASTICSAGRRSPATVALYCGRGPASRHPLPRRAGARLPPPAARRPRVLDPLPSASSSRSSSRRPGLVELLTRGPCPPATATTAPLLIALTVASALSLALLWWSPLASLCACLALLCTQSIAGYEFTQAAVWAVVVASFATVAFDHWRRAVAAGFLVAAGHGRRASDDVAGRHAGRRALSTWASLSVVWVVAIVIRVYRGSIERAERRAALFAADREARAREAVAEERARLARELHDSVGPRAQRGRAARGRRAARHRDQAGAGPRGAGVASRRPAARRWATSSACSASCARPTRRRGLDAAPGLGQLEALCDQVREAGLPVDAHRGGRAAGAAGQPRPDRLPHRPGGADQHAQARRQGARVGDACATSEQALAHRGRWTTAAAWRRPAASAGGGRGLLGMRERVATFGGELRRVRAPEGGFAVRARLPRRVAARRGRVRTMRHDRQSCWPTTSSWCAPACA